MEKIVHVMLTGPVTDGWSYQDNLLTKYHRRLGYEVTMITSQWIWGDDGKLKKCEKTDYRNENDVFVIRLPIRGRDVWTRKFKRFSGLQSRLAQEKPDILFVHNVCFLDMDVVVKYIRMRQGSPMRVYVDNHSDFSNSGRGWLSRNVLHKMLWRSKAAKIAPYTEKFYGVMPSRVEWLKEMYHLPEEACELLVMGADDDRVEEARKTDARSRIRKKYGIRETDFLIVTGGKIDQAKRQTLYLMEAVRNLSGGDLTAPKIAERLRLLVFGSVTEQLRPQMEALADGEIIQYVGWILPEASYEYFAAADLVVFPGRHSVYWEQVVGMKIPMICKYWDGTTHVDIGGNVKFLQEDGTEPIESLLLELLADGRSGYLKLQRAAHFKAADGFSYLGIAAKSIGM